MNLKITFKSQNLYHFKTPPLQLSMPLVARERKVSFSPHKSHLESFFFSESVFPSNSIMGLLWCYKIDFPGLVIKKVVKSTCRFLSNTLTTEWLKARNFGNKMPLKKTFEIQGQKFTKILRSLKQLFEQWNVRTIFQTECFYNSGTPGGFSDLIY